MDHTLPQQPQNELSVPQVQHPLGFQSNIMICNGILSTVAVTHYQLMVNKRNLGIVVCFCEVTRLKYWQTIQRLVASTAVALIMISTILIGIVVREHLII